MQFTPYQTKAVCIAYHTPGFMRYSVAFAALVLLTGKTDQQEAARGVVSLATSLLSKRGEQN